MTAPPAPRPMLSDGSCRQPAAFLGTGGAPGPGKHSIRNTTGTACDSQSGEPLPRSSDALRLQHLLGLLSLLGAASPTTLRSTVAGTMLGLAQSLAQYNPDEHC